MNIPRLALCFLASFMVVLSVGCDHQTESTVDPINGWKYVDKIEFECREMDAVIAELPAYKAITDDVQRYVNQLPVHKGGSSDGSDDRRETLWISFITLYEDGTGQHAVKIEIPVDGTYQNYVIIYDRNNTRIKAMKFASGHYMC